MKENAMTILFTSFLTLHIIGGTIGLLAGTFIMFRKKGDRIHQRIGKLFAYCMLAAGLSSLILATLHRNDFLLAVGVFTIFMTGTGWRYLYLKEIAKGQKIVLIDWILMVFMLIFGLFLVGLGFYYLMNKSYFGIIPLLFAWRGISFVISDYKTYKGKITLRNYWLIFHLQRMVGAYIASLTAFLVVNAPDKSGFLPWLLPSLIVVPFIVKWSRKYSIKSPSSS